MRAKAQESFPQELAERAARRVALRLVYYKRNLIYQNSMIFCLFVCAELIEELARVQTWNLARVWKMLLLGTNSKILAISPLISEKGDKMSRPIRFEGSVISEKWVRSLWNVCIFLLCLGNLTKWGYTLSPLLKFKRSFICTTSRNAALRAAFSASSCGKLFWAFGLHY